MSLSKQYLMRRPSLSKSVRQPSATANLVGAREAQTLLEISRTQLHKIVKLSLLPGRLVDKKGVKPHWIFKRRDVLKLKAKGNYVSQRHRPRKQHEIWERHYGLAPEGFTPAFRDGDRSNTAVENLCLVPLRSYRRHTRQNVGTRKQSRFDWTPEILEKLKREFPVRSRPDIAKDLGIALATLSRQIKKLGLRKDRAFVAEAARIANRLPLGTERVKAHTGIVWVKVAHEGVQYRQWRPKHHVVWEEAHGREVPKGWCLQFKDGNKRNFELSNLELATKREVTTMAFARYMSYPDSLKKVIRLTAKLERAIASKRTGDGPAAKPSTPGMPRHKRTRRWSDEMDAVLIRDYPVRPVSELMEVLGVTKDSIRNRAGRLGVHRLPETMIAEARAIAAKEKFKAFT